MASTKIASGSSFTDKNNKNTGELASISPGDLAQAQRCLEQGDLNGARRALGQFVKAIGITHSGAIKYDIGQQQTQDGLIIARAPLPRDHPDHNQDVSTALQNYFDALRSEASPSAYARAGQCGDKILEACEGDWARCAAMIRYG